MDVQELQDHFMTFVNWGSDQFVKIPGSAIFLRYVKSSYQDDPIRSAVELFLVLFAIRYLLTPKYSTKPGVVTLSEDVGIIQAESNSLDTRPGNRRPRRRLDARTPRREDDTLRRRGP
jgi:hypothetical protein